MKMTIHVFAPLLAGFLALADVAEADLSVTSQCGSPLSEDGTPTSRDALFVLRASVDLVDCNRCVCDLDDSGAITASDSLKVLRDAVGLAVTKPCCCIRNVA